MPIVRVPLAQPIESRTESFAKDSRGVNCLFETRDGSKRELVKRPGLKKLTTNPTITAGDGHGLYAGITGLYAGIGSNLYRLDINGNVTTIGNVDPGTPYQLSFTQTATTTPSGQAAYTSSGTFTVPANVTTINVTVVGAGGGSGCQGNDNTGYASGGYGGDGEVVTQSVTVTPGQVLTISVGTGGYGGTYSYPYAQGGSAGNNNAVAGSGGGYAGGGGGGGGYTSITGTAVNVVARGGGGGAGQYFIINGGSYSGSAGGAGGGATVGAGGAGGSPNGGNGGGYTNTTSYGKGSTASQSAYSGSAAAGKGGDGYISITYTAAYTTPQNYTFFHNGTTGYYIAPGASTATTITGFPTGPIVPGCAYLDGYIFVMTTQGRIYNSGINDPTTWGALNYISAEAEPDYGVAICKHLNYVVAFGEWTTQFFYDAANALGSPLAVNPSANLEIGCANGNSVQVFDQSVIWVGKSRQFGKGVYLLEGTSPVKVSTRYIEKYLNSNPLDSIRSCSFKIAGHTLYVLTIHSANVTLVYDIDEKIWYEWTTWDGSQEVYFRPSFYATYNNVPYLLDDDNGNIYILDTNTYQDNGQNIYVRVITDIMDSGTTKSKFYRSVEVVGDKLTSSSTASIRHTDDDYNTWSSYRTVDLSRPRAQILQCGRSRRRAWEFLYMDNYPLRIEALEMNVDVGGLSDTGPMQHGFRRGS